MRTTVRLDEHLPFQAKQHATEFGKTLTAVLEDALRESPARRHGVRVFHRAGERCTLLNGIVDEQGDMIPGCGRHIARVSVTATRNDKGARRRPYVVIR